MADRATAVKPEGSVAFGLAIEVVAVSEDAQDSEEAGMPGPPVGALNAVVATAAALSRLGSRHKTRNEQTGG